MRHSKRTTLSTDDVDSALTLRNVEVHLLFSYYSFYSLTMSRGVTTH